MKKLMTSQEVLNWVKEVFWMYDWQTINQGREFISVQIIKNKEERIELCPMTFVDGTHGISVGYRGYLCGQSGGERTLKDAEEQITYLLEKYKFISQRSSREEQLKLF